MDKGVIYSKNWQVSVFFSVELIDILSQVQPADVDGEEEYPSKCEQG